MTGESEFIEIDLADQAIHGDPDPNFLYERKDSYIPRIAAVHDLFSADRTLLLAYRICQLLYA